MSPATCSVQDTEKLPPWFRFLEMDSESSNLDRDIELQPTNRIQAERIHM